MYDRDLRDEEENPAEAPLLVGLTA